MADNKKVLVDEFFRTAEIYCVVCGNFVLGKETEGGEGICQKCQEQIEKIVAGE